MRRGGIAGAWALAVVVIGACLSVVVPAAPAHAICADGPCGGGGGTTAYYAYVDIGLQSLGSSTIQGSVNGGQLTSACTASCTDSVVSTSGASLSYTATPSSGWAVDHWSGCTSVSGATCTIQPAYSLTASRTTANTSTISVYFRDATPPTASFGSAPIENAFVSQWSPTYQFGYDGTGTAASPSRCAIDNTAYACTSATSFSFSGSSVTEAYHTVSITIRDGGGNTTTIQRHFTEDRTPPDLTVTGGPASGDWLPTPSASFTFTTWDSNSVTLRCWLDNVYRSCSYGGGDTLTGLADGQHTWEVESVDPAGNGRFATRTFGVDTAPPTATFTDGPAEGAATSETTPTFTYSVDGTGSPVSTACQIDGGAAYDCTGATTLTPSAPLADGPHSVSLHARDAAGNATDVTRDFTVDTSVPSLSVTSGPAGDYVDSSTVTFGFTASSGTTVACSLDHEAFRPCSSGDTDVEPSLTEGSHDWQVQASNSAGTTATVSRSFTVDTVLPTAHFLTGPADGAMVKDTDVTFTFATDGTGTAATATCRLDGDTTGHSCPGTEQLSGLSDGTHTLTVVVRDQAGNSVTLSRQFTVDTVAPAIRMLGGPTDQGATGNATVTFAFSTENGATLRCSLDGESDRACSGTGDDTLDGLADGTHHWQVTATDAAGNATTRSIAFTVDTVPPGGLFTGGPADGGATNDSTPTFGFVADGTGTAATVTCSVDGSVAGACTTDSTFVPPQLADGDHTVEVDIADAAGNTATISRTFTVDTVAPTLSILSGPADGSAIAASSVTFGYSAENGATTNCRLDGGPWVLCTGTGADTTDGLSEAPHSWGVRATDAAGNTAVLSRSFTVDLTKPTVQVAGRAHAFTLRRTLSFAWKPADTSSGVASSDVQLTRASRSGGFGTWTTRSGWTGTDATRVSVKGARGYTYCFRVEVHDRAGNTSDWTAPRCTALPVDDRTMTASSGWTRGSGSHYYAGTLSSTRHRHATLTLTKLRAKQLALVATTCSSCGTVGVYRGSTLLHKISLHSATTHRKVLLPVASWSSVRTGTIRVKVLTRGKPVGIDGLAASQA